MAEDNHKQPESNDHGEISPSAMFLEMMRQAALRKGEASPSDDLISEKPSFNALEFHIVRDDDYDANSDDVPDNDPSLPDDDAEIDDTRYQAEAELFDMPTSAEQDVRPSDLDTSSATADNKAPPRPADTANNAPTAPDNTRRVPIYTAPTNDDAPAGERLTQLEAQRIQRLKRRRERRQRRRVGILGGFLRTAFVAIVAAALGATVFTWFTDPEFFTPNVVSGLQVAQSTSVMAAAPLTPSAIPVTPNWARRIGIVSGHRGPENDPGAVCPDGLTEREINFAVAQLVVRGLRERGYSVDLLDEFDPRLDTYQAAALVSIHANDCRDYGEYVSGYLVARAAARPAGGLDDVLAECVARDYGDAVQIERRFSLTIDMTDYHTFREIHPLTPAAIIELGFMKDDRDLLTNQQPLIAEGIIDGILCFLNGENPLNQPTEVPDTQAEITPEANSES
ncbi:MAG: N-acetylmuramoyl-L-alanine amidase family protein [Anaerolineae bacterium]